MAENFLCDVPVQEVKNAKYVTRTVGELEILILDTTDGIRVYNGVCPHLGGLNIVDGEVAYP